MLAPRGLVKGLWMLAPKGLMMVPAGLVIEKGLMIVKGLVIAIDAPESSRAAETASTRLAPRIDTRLMVPTSSSSVSGRNCRWRKLCSKPLRPLGKDGSPALTLRRKSPA
jgi:hypothetical protein